MGAGRVQRAADGIQGPQGRLSPGEQRTSGGVISRHNIIHRPVQPEHRAASTQELTVLLRQHRAAAGGDNAGCFRLCAERFQRPAFQGTEGSLALRGEDRRNGTARCLLRQRVRVVKGHGQRPGQGGADGGLSAGGHTDKDDPPRHACSSRESAISRVIRRSA